MPSETTVLRPKVVKAFKHLHMTPVENPVKPGTPDLNFTNGWIELKHSETFVKLDHYKPQQRLWAIKRRMAGGNCWFWWQIGNDHLILDGADAAYLINLVDYDYLLTVALYIGPFDKKEIEKCISQKQNGFWSTAEGRLELKLRLHEALRSL